MKKIHWIACVSLLAFSGLSWSEDIIVNSYLDNEDVDGICTLREALASSIDDHVNLETGCADGEPGIDKIYIDQFYDDKGRPIPITLNRPLDIFDSVEVYGAGIDDTIIQAADNVDDAEYRLINVNSGRLTLSDLTLRHGNATRMTGNELGGAILSNASLELDNVKVKYNKANSGGAIAFLARSGRLNISRTIFRNNSAIGTGETDGGGALITAGGAEALPNMAITKTTFFNNVATSGGGAVDYNGKGVLEIDNSTFYANEGGTRGGGAVDVGGAVRLGGVYLNNVTITKNVSASTDRAGGIDTGYLTRDNSRPMSVYNSILVGNFNNSGGRLSLAECSALDENGRKTDGYFRSAFNLYGRDGGCMETTFTQPDQTAPNFRDDETLEDIRLSEYLDFQAFDPEENPYLLVKNDSTSISPIINRGQAEAFASSFGSQSCRPDDQRGLPRSSGNRCDRGAIEFIYPTAVNDGYWDNSVRKNRSIIVDLLKNDIVDSSAEIDFSSIRVIADKKGDPRSSEELRRFRQKYYYDELLDRWIAYDEDEEDAIDATGGEEGLRKRELLFKLVRSDAPEVVNFELINRRFSDYVLHITERNDLPFFDTTANDQSGTPITFEYSFKDTNGLRSATGEAAIQLFNTPPFPEPDEVLLTVPQTVVIDVLSNDRDYDSPLEDPDGDGRLPESRLNYASLRFATQSVQGPQFALTNADGEAFGSGVRLETIPVILGSPTTGTTGRVVQVPTGRIIYTPANSFQTFNDRFFYVVEDTDGQESAPASVNITYEDIDYAGGDLGEILDKPTSGSLPVAYLFSAVLLLAIRRRVVQSRL